MARAREIPGLSGDMSFAEAGRRVVAVRAEEMFEHAHDVLHVDDIERVHDMRVATRRLRAALEIFRPCFPKREFKVALRDVKRLADALGERRDRDVAIADLDELGKELSPADRPGITALVEQLRAEQMAANVALAHHVDDERLGALRERIAKLLGTGPG